MRISDLIYKLEEQKNQIGDVLVVECGENVFKYSNACLDISRVLLEESTEKGVYSFNGIFWEEVPITSGKQVTAIKINLY